MIQETHIDGGFHSAVVRGVIIDDVEQEPDIHYVAKHFGEPGEFTVQSATEMISSIKRFNEMASAIGVHIPELMGYALVNQPDDPTIKIKEVVKNAGLDLKTLINDHEYSNEDILGFIGGYLGEFHKVWDAGFPISLDPVPANFCVNADRKVTYVDGMPPRQRLPDRDLLSERPHEPSYSQAFIQARYFSPLQARVIYAQLLRATSEREIDPAILREMIGEHLGPLAKSLVDIKPKMRKEVLSKPDEGDVDILRILAAEAAYEGKLTKDEVKALFSLVHIDAGGKLPKKENIEFAALAIRDPEAARNTPFMDQGTNGVESTLVERQGFKPRAWAILDLDGVVLRWTKADLPDPEDIARLQNSMNKFKDRGLGIAVLTNRPPGQMAAIAYELGVDYGTWVTESSGSMYDVKGHRLSVSPDYLAWQPRIAQLRDYLHDHNFIEGVSTNRLDAPTNPAQQQFEPGMGMAKTVIVPPNAIRPEDYAEVFIRPALEQGGFLEDFDIKVGKAIDIDPKGLSKARGMELLLELNGIDPAVTPVVFVADEIRDIDAATVLTQRGGIAAAVRNSNPEYLRAVESAGGIVAAEGTKYHSSLENILERFLNEYME